MVLAELGNPAVMLDVLLMEEQVCCSCHKRLCVVLLVGVHPPGRISSASLMTRSSCNSEGRLFSVGLCV